MNSFPTRTRDSLFADVLLRQSNYDLFLFIEDEKMPQVYKKIISRLFDNKVKVGKVFSLKSKDNVIKKFQQWLDTEDSLSKCIFIIDKDFNHFKDESIEEHLHLIELEYYTIENYFISKEGILPLLQSKIFDKDEDEIIELLDWENWLNDTHSIFKELFIAYAIAFKYDLKENCGLSPYIYLKKNSSEINIEKTQSYINEIKEICSLSENVDYFQEYNYIENYFNEVDGYNYNKLIKGKYLYATLLKRINYKTGKKIDEDLGSLVIADNIPLNELNFIKRKISNALSI